MKLAGEPSLGLLFRYLSTSRLVTIAQIAGRVRGAGSEFVLACDMRFAARESAIFSQPELGFGLIPGAGGIQHLTRLLGRARALEVMMSADDYDAEVAERYGWINRAMSKSALGEYIGIARAPHHQVSCRWPRCYQSSGQCHRPRSGRGVPSRFGFVSGARSQSRIEADRARDVARVSTREGEMELTKMLDDLVGG